jgi:hypothetical protein
LNPNKRTEGLRNGLEEKNITEAITFNPMIPQKPTFTAEQKLKYAKWGITV